MNEEAPLRADAAGPPACRQSPLRLFAIIALAILTTEFALMLAFEWLLPPMPGMVQDLLDGVLLTILLSPVLYLFVFRPVRANMAALEEAQALLRQQRDHLEDEVARRTAELSGANAAMRAAFRESDDLYQNAPCGYHSLDATGRYVRINDTELKMLGYTREEIVGRKRMQDLLTPRSRERFAANFPPLKERGPVYDEDAELYRKDGSILHALLSVGVVRDAEGRFVKTRTTVYDMTERKQAEQSQMRLNRALRLLSEGSAMLIHAEDEQALLHSICRLVVNTGGYLMAWVGFAEHDGEKTVRPVAHAGADEGYLGSIAVSWGDNDLGHGPTGTAIRTGTTQINQNWLIGRHLKRWLDAAQARGYQSSIALPIASKDGVLGALTIYSSEPEAFVHEEVKLLEELVNNLAYGIEALRMRATKAEADRELELHRRHLEERVAQRTAEAELARQEAERANNAKSRFLAAASHDLRQPLSALKLYAGILRTRLDATDTSLLENVDGCVASLSDLLSKLLDISKLEAGVVKPRVSAFLLDELVHNVLAAQTPEAKAKGLRLSRRCPSLTVRTDPVLLQRIVANFVSNAILNTSTGGVLIGCRRYRGKRWIEVWDTGTGIPADKVGEIFEEFRQLGDEAQSRGSGLGLAIAAKTADVLGLQVRVQSRLNRGSMFAIEVPVGRAARESAPQEAPSPAQGVRVAVVDDNEAVLNALALALANAGHEVVAASTGETLLACLGSRAPDIMICDYRLGGGKTGADVIASARDVFGTDIPAVIITGDTDPALKRRLSRKGIAMYHKPVDFEDLQTRIAEMLDRATPVES